MQALPLGVNSYSYIWDLSADDVLRRYAALGYRDFELMAAPPHLWPSQHSPAARAATRRLAEELGVRIVSLNAPSLDQNLVSPVGEMRAYTVQMFRDLITLASDLGASHVVTVCGRIHPLFAPPRNLVEGWLHAGLEEIIPHAKAAGIRLALENIPMSAMPLADDLVNLVQTFGPDVLSICYDVANAEFAREDPAEGLVKVRQHLELVHVSDTGRDAWRHDPVGMGQVDFAGAAAALREIGYRGPTMMEIISLNPDVDIADSHRKLAACGWAGPA